MEELARQINALPDWWGSTTFPRHVGIAHSAKCGSSSTDGNGARSDHARRQARRRPAAGRPYAGPVLLAPGLALFPSYRLSIRSSMGSGLGLTNARLGRPARVRRALQLREPPRPYPVPGQPAEHRYCTRWPARSRSSPSPSLLAVALNRGMAFKSFLRSVFFFPLRSRWSRWASRGSGCWIRWWARSITTSDAWAFPPARGSPNPKQRCGDRPDHGLVGDRLLSGGLPCGPPGDPPELYEAAAIDGAAGCGASGRSPCRSSVRCSSSWWSPT